MDIMLFLLVNLGLIIWIRSESRNDFRHLDNKIESIRLESYKKFKNLNDN